MKLKIRVKQTRTGVITLSPVGKIDSDTHVLLDKEITKLLNEPIHTLILDMEGVDFITSSGVGTITKAKTSLKQKSAELAMINLQPQVKKVFEIIRLLPALSVFESMEELDEYLAKIQHKVTEDSDDF